MLVPESCGPPPITTRTGLPQVCASTQLKVNLAMSNAGLVQRPICPNWIQYAIVRWQRGSFARYDSAFVTSPASVFMPVKFEDLQMAFDFVNFGAPGEHQAYLDTQTGLFHWHSDVGDNFEELPDDLDDERYIEIPHKNELDLGKSLVFDFVRQFLPDDYDDVRDIFRRRGAYGQFKAMLARRNVVDRWHDFSAKAEEAALRAWCADNAIELVD
jgi:hypothetical protein